MRVTISGSFNRHLKQMEVEAAELTSIGFEVLSPRSFKRVDHYQGFTFVEGDHGNLKEIQDRHNDAIKRSDLLWIVAPDGYAGVSVALEMGIAICSEIPIYGFTKPTDTTLAEYVQVITDMKTLLSR